MGHYDKQEQSVYAEINKENFRKINNIVEYIYLIQDDVEHFRKYGGDHLGRIAFDQLHSALLHYRELHRQIKARLPDETTSNP